MKATTSIILESETESFIDNLKAKGGRPIYKLTPEEARSVLEDLQSSSIEKPKIHIEEKTISTAKGKISIHIVRPSQSSGKSPAIVYFHGAGWVMGSFNTHERLMCDLAAGANAAVVFVNYSRSPEAKYPIAIEEAYAATQYIAEHGKDFNLDTSHLTIAGDSVGGNMSIAVALLAQERHGPKIDSLILYYPVTSAEMNTQSYHDFAEGPWLTKPAMEWFWNAYQPSTSSRNNPLLSPLNATIDQLKGFPRTLLLTAEYDVLRDEGEAFAHKLIQASVNVSAVRLEGTIHDFMMLNALAKTPAAQTGLALTNAFLKMK